MTPLNVAATYTFESTIISHDEEDVFGLTLVKLAIPPPMNKTLPSGCVGARNMRSRTVFA